MKSRLVHLRDWLLAPIVGELRHLNAANDYNGEVIIKKLDSILDSLCDLPDIKKAVSSPSDVQFSAKVDSEQLDIIAGLLDYLIENDDRINKRKYKKVKQSLNYGLPKRN